MLDGTPLFLWDCVLSSMPSMGIVTAASVPVAFCFAAADGSTFEPGSIPTRVVTPLPHALLFIGDPTKCEVLDVNRQGVALLNKGEFTLGAGADAALLMLAYAGACQIWRVGVRSVEWRGLPSGGI